MDEVSYLHVSSDHPKVKNINAGIENFIRELGATMSTTYPNSTGTIEDSNVSNLNSYVYKIF